MKNLQKQIQEKKARRKKRTSLKIRTHSQRPRLSVFRSGKHIYVQVIDDQKSITLVSASDKEIKEKTSKKDQALAVGALLAKKCLEKKIDKVAFDKGGYRYHGRVANLAEGARQGGLIF